MMYLLNLFGGYSEPGGDKPAPTGLCLQAITDFIIRVFLTQMEGEIKEDLRGKGWNVRGLLAPTGGASCGKINELLGTGRKPTLYPALFTDNENDNINQRPVGNPSGL